MFVCVCVCVCCTSVCVCLITVKVLVGMYALYRLPHCVHEWLRSSTNY